MTIKDSYNFKPLHDNKAYKMTMRTQQKTQISDLLSTKFCAFFDSEYSDEAGQKPGGVDGVGGHVILLALSQARTV